MAFSAAIFDMDGTLLDSHWVWREVDRVFSESIGVKLSADYTFAIEHMSPSQAAAYTVSRYHLSISERELEALWLNIAFDFYANDVRPKPGAKELLQALKDRGVRLCLATACFADLAAVSLKAGGVYELFEKRHFGASKDSEAVYLSCAEELSLPPCDCAVFEDILSPLPALKQAGMGFFAVKDARQGKQTQEKLRAQADCFIESYEDFLRSDGLTKWF